MIRDHYVVHNEKTGIVHMMQKRCIALYSGGLDSILAVRLMESLGVDVIPMYFCTPFFGYDALNDPESMKAVHRDKFGIDIRIIDYSDDMIRIVSNPDHGFGKYLNPCIDCKIGMLRKVKALLEEFDASFAITGEVLGQRPMSQRADTMRIIEKESGLKGLLVRPLCALHLTETLPEVAGIVKREGLWGITGRGRKEQISRALAFGIRKEDIPNAAGGCLLADKQISAKVKKTLMRHSPLLPTKEDCILDIIGRKFILDTGTILLVGRDERENEIISTLSCHGNVFLRIDDVPGPLCILRGKITYEALDLAAGICLRYTKAKGAEGKRAVYGTDSTHMDQSFQAPVFTEEYCASFQD